MGTYSLAEDYDGDTALVTGGAQGIGRGIAEVLADLGCTVVINDVDSDTLAETVADFQTEGMSSIGLEEDVFDPDEVDVLFDEIEDRFGNLDILVNNAAVIDSAAYNEITPDKWRRVLSVDLDGVHYCCSAGAPLLTDSENGSIVNVASIAGQRISLLAGAHYTTAKWGIIGLTKHIAEEYGPHEVRVNAVCPGPTETARIKDLVDSEQREQIATEDIAMGRWVQPEDIGFAVAFLASRMASFVTGTTLTIDGGFTIR